MTTLVDRPVAAARRITGPRRTGPRRPPPPPRPQRPATQVDRTLALVSTTATMCVLVTGWALAQMLFLGGLAEQRAQQELYGQLRRDLASATASVGPLTPVGTPVALLRIPDIGVEQVVVEGTASGDLLVGPGHLRDTVLPGQEGTSAVFGRATTFGAPFARIGELRPGATINVVGSQGEKIFRVIGLRRAGDPLPQPREPGTARLVLVSAAGQGGRLPGLSPGEVVYVDAEAAKAFPAPAGLPAAVPDPEQAMGTEPGAVPLLALCLALLLATTLGVVAARQRFSAALVWVVASPIAIAGAWVTTDVVMRLLPNLM